MRGDVNEIADGGIDPRQYRQALGRYATGVTVVTTRGRNGKLEGLTANSFASVSLDPPLVLWSLKDGAASLPNFAESGWFAINVLGAAHQHLSHHFATPSVDKFAGVDFLAGIGGCPLLPDALASFECSVEQKVIAGDHTIFIGRVQRLMQRDGEPLIFTGGAFCRPALLRATA